jgi:hypothetical protein
VGGISFLFRIPRRVVFGIRPITRDEIKENVGCNVGKGKVGQLPLGPLIEHISRCHRQQRLMPVHIYCNSRHILTCMRA